LPAKAEKNAGITALFMGVYNSLPVCKMLIQHGADVNAARGKSGATPVFVAAQEGRLKTVKLLLKHGAKIDTISQTSKGSPLHVRRFKNQPSFNEFHEF